MCLNPGESLKATLLEHRPQHIGAPRMDFFPRELTIGI
jgi:hypothetical protein